MKLSIETSKIKLACKQWTLVSQMTSFQAGDQVRIKSDKQLVQNLQQGHGGWNESMSKVSVSLELFSLIALCFQLPPHSLEHDRLNQN